MELELSLVGSIEESVSVFDRSYAELVSKACEETQERMTKIREAEEVRSQILPYLHHVLRARALASSVASISRLTTACLFWIMRLGATSGVLQADVGHCGGIPREADKG